MLRTKLVQVRSTGKCKNLPSFSEANKFAVEKYFYENPIGGHQFWYCVPDLFMWLNKNLKNRI